MNPIKQIQEELGDYSKETEAIIRTALQTELNNEGLKQ